MPQHFVKIVNRGTYTNVRKAQRYVERGLAEVFVVGLNRLPIQIRMLEAAELVLLKSHIRRVNRDENIDDGIERRWVNKASGSAGPHRPAPAVNGNLIQSREPGKQDRCGYGLIVPSPAGIHAKQLRPVKQVGTGRHVTKQSDDLIRRQAPPRRFATNA